MKPVEYHGESRLGKETAEYQVWRSMVNRCYCPSDTNYPRYDAVGIRVCQRWRDSLIAFVTDMGRRPSDGHSIDRIDSRGNYEPENCRWATRTEQNRNTKRNRMITIDGVTRCMSEWSEITGIPAMTIKSRLERNWSIDQLFIKAPSTGRWTRTKNFGRAAE